MATIKSTDELARVAALSAASALKQHGVDPKHIVAAQGTLAGHIDKHWIGIWIEENPHTQIPGLNGPIWIGIIAQQIDQKALGDVKQALKTAGFGH